MLQVNSMAVTDLSELKVCLKTPQKTEWREVDLKKLFTD